MKKIFSSYSYRSVYFTACIIPLLAFTFFHGAHANELYKPQHPHYSVALDVYVAA